MAGRRWLVPPVQGLLICILALHLHGQDHLAAAENSTAATTPPSVTNSTVATTTALVTNSTAATTTASVAHSTSATTNALVTNSTAATTTASVAHSTSATTNALVTNSTAATTSVVHSTVATTNASVATNASVNGTERTPLTCQSFRCSGERCYQDEAHANETVTCHNETYCELYRFSTTNYTAGCSSGCSAETCRTNGSLSRQQCVLDCCGSPRCLQLNASSYGDLPPPTAPPTTTTTTPRSPPRNGKVCAAFSCHGDGCFKGKKAVARCIVGHDFCEMKKTGLNYVAGCSRACKVAKPVCAGGVKAACYQECCPATLKSSCLKLDGKVHVNSAGQATLAPLLKLVVWGVVLLLNCRVSASLWG